MSDVDKWCQTIDPDTERRFSIIPCVGDVLPSGAIVAADIPGQRHSSIALQSGVMFIRKARRRLAVKHGWIVDDIMTRTQVPYGSDLVVVKRR